MVRITDAIKEMESQGFKKTKAATFVANNALNLKIPTIESNGSV